MAGGMDLGILMSDGGQGPRGGGGAEAGGGDDGRIKGEAYGGATSGRCQGGDVEADDDTIYGTETEARPAEKEARAVLEEQDQEETMVKVAQWTAATAATAAAVEIPAVAVVAGASEAAAVAAVAVAMVAESVAEMAVAVGWMVLK